MPNDPIALPAKSRALLVELIQEQKRIAGLIEATISGIRSALDVPEGWALRTLDEGFVAPAQAEEVPPEE